jgi:hypothetical protein
MLKPGSGKAVQVFNPLSQAESQFLYIGGAAVCKMFPINGYDPEVGKFSCLFYCGF